MKLIKKLELLDHLKILFEACNDRQHSCHGCIFDDGAYCMMTAQTDEGLGKIKNKKKFIKSLIE